MPFLNTKLKTISRMDWPFNSRLLLNHSLESLNQSQILECQSFTQHLVKCMNGFSALMMSMQHAKLVSKCLVFLIQASGSYQILWKSLRWKQKVKSVPIKYEEMLRNKITSGGGFTPLNAAIQTFRKKEKQDLALILKFGASFGALQLNINNDMNQNESSIVISNNSNDSTECSCW